MMQVVEKWTERHTVDECIAALDTAGVPCARYRDPGAALADPHLIERGAFAKLRDGAGEFRGVNAPWKMSDAETTIRPDIPATGAHRDEVLSRDVGPVIRSDRFDLAQAGVFGKHKEQKRA